MGEPEEQAAAGDYRHRLRPTHLGWRGRAAWRVWDGGGAEEGPAFRWDSQWRKAVDGALEEWAELLAITLVEDPQQAQVLVWRRRPPLRGRRASHGRAELELRLVQRLEHWHLEPRVVVSISPGQRQAATQATALHELGHAFGLWGHSEVASDAMAAVPGAQPVMNLTSRDRATVRWLQEQPGLRADPERSAPQECSPWPAELHGAACPTDR